MNENGFERLVDTQNAALSLSKVFTSTDPFAACFEQVNDYRLILYPTSGYILNNNQFDALGKAAATVYGESYALVTLTEPHNSEDQCSDVWRLCLKSYSAYIDLRDVAPITLENCLFSSTGRWGVTVLQESHAVICGSHTFIEEFQKQLNPNSSTQLQEFLTCWEQNRLRINSSTSWIAPLLQNVYGKARAKEILRSHPLLKS